MPPRAMFRSSRFVGALGIVALVVATSVATGAAPIYSSGVAGYSGKNSSKTCANCHSGGSAPSVAFSGPKYVLQNTQRSFGLTISGGQQIAGGFGIARDVGTLVAADSGTAISSGELIQTTPRNADGSGNVSWTFDLIAPAAPATVNLWGCGNSVDLNGKISGDASALATDAVTVVDNLVRFTSFGVGLAGTGGAVPVLAGIDGPSVGPWSIQISNGLGGASGLLWYGFGSADYFPFLGGHFYIDLTGPFGRVPIVLSGPAGVAGAGSLTLNGIDVSAYAPFTMYFQVTLFDAGAVKHVSLTNGLEMDVEK